MQARYPQLDRVLNFRDFGGYDTADGGRVAHGRLYRSAHFAEASEADVAKLETLGVAAVVDLRRADERAHEPNRWPGETARTIVSDEGPASALPPHLQALLAEDVTARSVADYMRRTYRDFPHAPRYVALYRAWFAHLIAGEGAGVIHCAAGKDRTGLGCALTLIALGVSEEDVYADYELTNAVLNLDERLPRIQARMEERLGRSFSAEALRPMLGVDVDYLREALDEIETRDGSVFAYLERELGVGARERDLLRARLAQQG